MTLASDPRMNARMLLQQFVTGSLETNTYLVADRDTGEALVIDPGGDPGEILAFLAKERLTCRLIVNTHGHFDHISGNRALKSATGASLLVHEGDVPMLTEAATHARFFMLRAENSPPPDVLLADQGEVPGRLGVVAGAAHAGALAGGGHAAWRRVWLFAVTWSSTVRWDARTCRGGRSGFSSDSIRRHILPLPDDTVLYPGHGPETTVGLEKRQNPFFRLAGR